MHARRPRESWNLCAQTQAWQRPTLGGRWLALALMLFLLATGANAQTAALGGQIWLDRDGDGSAVGDPGLAGITVLVEATVGQTLGSAVTAADGSYLITGLPDGFLTVLVDPTTLPEEVSATFEIDGLTDGFVSVSTKAGEPVLDVDWGFQGTALIDGWVFEDINADGVLDLDEVGIPGATVTLTNATGIHLATTSDANGIYRFDGIPAGTYTVEVDPASLLGWNAVSDPDGLVDLRTVLTVSSAAPVNTAFFGFNDGAVFEGRVILDLSPINQLDPGDMGLVGVAMLLLDDQDVLLTSVDTTAGGAYRFDNLSPGTYTVWVDSSTLPFGMLHTFDPDGLLDRRETRTVTVGDRVSDLDFGFVGDASIGDQVFLDINGNGIEDPGDTGIVGAEVTLTDLGSGESSTFTTLSFGSYVFAGLPAGTYLVSVDPASLPAGLQPAWDRDGVLDNQTTVSLANSETVSDANFTYNGQAMVSGVVYSDDDGDGSQGPGEMGFENFEVVLRDSLGNTLATQQTDASGTYAFGNLSADTYTVAVFPDLYPQPYQQTEDPDAILDDQTDVMLTTGESVTGLDFGYFVSGTLIGAVFEDANGDGFPEGSEEGLANVRVELYDLSNTLITDTLTDVSSGFFQFDNLASGDYFVRVDPSTLPSNVTQTFDTDGLSTPHEVSASVTAGSLVNVDFGYVGPGGFVGTVVDDADLDGLPSSGDVGLPNISVEVFDGAGTPLTTLLTDGSGTFYLEGLLPGNYVARVDPATLPPNVTQSFDTDGLSTPNEVAFTVDAGQTFFGIEFGYQAPGGFVGTVLDDADLDGLPSPGDVGLPNISVEILDGAGTPFTTLLTDGSGSFYLEGLLPGNYVARVDPATLPPNVTQSFDTDGLSTPHEVAFTVDAGQTFFGIEFGYQGPGGFVGTVVDDADLDGLPSSGDVGLPNISVEILDGAGTPFATLLTDGAGYFSLDGLLPGNYVARVDPATLPPNVTQSFDTDGLTTPHEVAFTVDAGQTFFGIEFGYQGPGGFVGTVVDDADLDGVPSSGDVGLPNISVEILDGAGTPFTTLLTDGAGYFSLDGLLPGNYIARVDPATLPPNVTQSFDTDGLSTPHEVAFTVDAGQTFFGIEFGYQGPGGFVGTVFDDADLDGVPSSGDVGLPNISVEILDGAGTPFTTLLTDGAGYFSLDGLLPGNYVARVDPATLPPNVTQSFDTDGLSTPHEVAFTVDAGQTFFGIEFGYQGPGGFVGTVVDDADLDGVPSSGDVGLPNISVEILDGAGTPFTTLLTDGAGYFSLDGLLPGNYIARVDPATLPPNVTQSFDTDGLSTPHEVAFTVDAGQTFFGIEFGYQGPGGFVGTVFDDADLDGVPSSGDVGLPNISVEILDGAGTPFTTLLTDGSGYFSLDGLLPGNYVARVDPATLPAGYSQVFDLDGLSTPHEVAFTVDAGQTFFGVEFGYAAAVVDPDLLAHWRLDESSGGLAADATGNGHDGTWSGGVTPITGFLGGGLAFDGQSGVVEVAAAPALDNLGTVTMTAWIRHSAGGGWRSILDKRDNSNDGFDLYINNQNRLFMRANNTTLTGSLTVADGNWHHVAGVYDGAVMRLYVDGVADGTRNIGAISLDTTSVLLLGENYARNNSFYGGDLDDVRLYSRALSVGEIDTLVQEGLLANDATPPVRTDGAPSGTLGPATTSIDLTLTTNETAECRWSTSPGVDFATMTAPFDTPVGTAHSRAFTGLVAGSYTYYVRCQDLAGNANGDDYVITFSIAEPGDPTVGLVGYWPFEDGSGTTASDLSGNANAGTLANGPLWTSGQIGGALAFDGTDDAVTFTAAPALDDATEITLSAWINHSATTGWRSIIDKRDGAFDGYDLYISSAGRLFMRVNNQTLQGPTVVADGTWHHVVGVYDGNQMLLYVDGVLDTSSTVGSLTIDTWRTLRLGENWELGNSFFAGTMDEVRIYDRALDAGEVAELYTRTDQP